MHFCGSTTPSARITQTRTCNPMVSPRTQRVAILELLLGLNKPHGDMTQLGGESRFSV